MHQNAPMPDKKIKNNSAEGPPQTPPLLGSGYSLPGRGYSLPSSLARLHTLGAFGASILARSALGVPVPFHLRLEHCQSQNNVYWPILDVVLVQK